MVAELGRPPAPLPRGGRTRVWAPRVGAESWSWCRVYHRDHLTLNGHQPRTWGPMARFDHHRPDASGRAQSDPDGRSVLYVGDNLATSACEVFGEIREARLCPNQRVAFLSPTVALRHFDLTAQGSALAIGALPSLASGNEPRTLTQEWARAIYDEQPARSHVDGIRYRSAYNNGIALALWDSAGQVAETTDKHGKNADYALRDPAVLRRLETQLAARQITVSLIDAAHCPRCP